MDYMKIARTAGQTDTLTWTLEKVRCIQTSNAVIRGPLTKGVQRQRDTEMYWKGLKIFILYAICMHD